MDADRPKKLGGRVMGAPRWANTKENKLKQNLSAIIFIIMLAAISGCGGQSNAGESASPLVTYQFTATIDYYVDSVAPFPATVGDIITGTFSYDPKVVNQPGTAVVQVKIDTITLNGNLSSPISFLHVFDNTTNPSLRDVFSWLVVDTADAAQYGLDNIQISFYLDDITATAFDSSQPTNLDLNAFSTRQLSLGKEIRGVGASNFAGAQITSLHRVP